jgi:mRNA-degrading endonuclease YafQ of YafQ-DinJ toxin-antitoxin module
VIKIKFTGRYYRGLEKLLSQNLEYRGLIDGLVVLFRKKPQDTRLDIHPLKRRLTGKWAISVDNDVRIVFEWKGNHRVRFLAVDRHSEVYKK